MEQCCDNIIFIRRPVLRRSKKANCIRCNEVTTAYNEKRAGAICSNCIPFNKQKRSFDIILSGMKRLIIKNIERQ